MKKTLLAMLSTAAAVFILLAFAGSLHAQAEKVKGKGKDLKKQVEGKPAPTNSPPQKPKPK